MYVFGALISSNLLVWHESLPPFFFLPLPPHILFPSISHWLPHSNLKKKLVLLTVCLYQMCQCEKVFCFPQPQNCLEKISTSLARIMRNKIWHCDISTLRYLLFNYYPNLTILIFLPFTLKRCGNKTILTKSAGLLQRIRIILLIPPHLQNK